MFMDLLPWLAFTAFVLTVLAVDLGIFHRTAHEVGKREALAWTAVTVSSAIVFNVGVYVTRGFTEGLEWTSGYLIEMTLAVDNVFIWLLIFSHFAVPAMYQHRVLIWGVVGALIMRAILIAAAGVLLSTLHFVIYLFGGLLILTGIKFLREQQHAPSLDRNWLIRVARRLFGTTEGYEGQRFFVRRDGALLMTPLFLVLLLVEATDLIFAVDSIPAIYAITDDPFIVYTSNVFAILGLRSMYFVLSGYLGAFVYLKPSLAAILVFVGTKMLLTDVYKLHPAASLGVIVGILAVGILASVRKNRQQSAIAGGEAPAA